MSKSTYRFWEVWTCSLTYTGSTQGVAEELSVLMDQKLKEQQQVVSFLCDIRFVGLGSGVPEWKWHQISTDEEKAVKLMDNSFSEHFSRFDKFELVCHQVLHYWF